MPMWDKIMLRKRYIIECINELLKNKANLVHSRHRLIHNFIMNLCSALTAYCFFDNKPEALPVYVEKSKQLELLHTELIPNSSNRWVHLVACAWDVWRVVAGLLRDNDDENKCVARGFGVDIEP